MLTTSPLEKIQMLVGDLSGQTELPVRVFQMANDKLLYGLVVREEPDSLVLMHPCYLIRKPPSVGVQPMLGQNVVRVFKSSICAVALPRQSEKSVYLHFVKTEILAGNSIFPEEVIPEIEEFLSANTPSVEKDRPAAPSKVQSQPVFPITTTKH